MFNLDLSKLPKKVGKNKDRICWQDAIGCEIPFVYNNIIGTLIINDYNKNKQLLTITYDDFQTTITHNHLLAGKGLKRIIQKHTPRTLIQGVNDFNTKFPHLIKYLVNPTDGENTAPSSQKKVECKCTICGFKKEMSLNNLHRSGFSCPRCGDGYSYPSKVITALLEQIGIEYIREYTPDWSKGRKYDHYIPSLSLIIEEHGIQHYEDTWWTTFEKQHAIDIQKENMALKNNIVYYVQLDCRKSDIDFICNSINKSIIPSLLNFNDSDVNWKDIDIIASQTSMFEIVCKEWKSQENITTYELANKLKMSPSTICRYLKHGHKLGIVYYNPQEERAKSNQHNMKSVVQYSLNGIKIATYKSVSEAAEENNIPTKSIYSACAGAQKSTGGFMWRYESFDSIVPYEKEVCLGIMKAVIQYSLDGVEITTYESISKAAKTLHISDSNICNVCAGRAKTAGGFIWKYADESELIA